MDVMPHLQFKFMMLKTRLLFKKKRFRKSNYTKIIIRIKCIPSSDFHSKLHQCIVHFLNESNGIRALFHAKFTTSPRANLTNNLQTKIFFSFHSIKFSTNPSEIS